MIAATVQFKCKLPLSFMMQIRRLAAKVGVREGRDERDRRARHPPLLRLALPHGTGEQVQYVLHYFSV